MKVSRVLIFGNGRLSQQFLGEIKENDYVIGVDWAAYWLLSHKIIPKVAIGDFDSVSTAEMKLIRTSIKNVITYPPKKDETDLELAILHAVSKHPSSIVIYGALGGRMDHTVSGLHLLKKLLDVNIPTSIKDEHNEIFLTNTSVEVTNSNYTYISLLPITASATVTLKGFKYNVTKKKFLRHTSLGVSNELAEQVGKIVVHEGVVLVIKSRD